MATAGYIGQTLQRLTVTGALYLCVVCLPLEYLIGRCGLPEAFAGPAFVGMVTLILEIFDHLASLASLGDYEGLLRRTRRRS